MSRSQTRYMSMTLSETMKQCYEARELPTWGDILNAADEIDRLSRQLAEAQGVIESCKSWIERWTPHVGSCNGGHECTCGRSAILFEAGAALAQSAAMGMGEKP